MKAAALIALLLGGCGTVPVMQLKPAAESDNSLLMNLLLLDMLRERRVTVEERVVQAPPPLPREEVFCKPGDICAAPSLPPK